MSQRGKGTKKWQRMFQTCESFQLYKHAPAQNFLLCDKYRLFIFNDLSDLEMILPKSVSQNESSYAAGAQQSA